MTTMKKLHIITKEKLEAAYKKTGNLVGTAREIGERFKITKRYMDYYNIPYDIKPFHKRTINHNFFERDLEETFYVAGFIAADGCIIDAKKRSLQLQINLAAKDKEILIKINNLMGSTYPVRNSISRQTDDNFPQVRLSVSSTKLCRDLERFGISPRKSLTYIMPDWLTQHPLVNHFIRGYVDGDGCFSASLPKRINSNHHKEKTAQMRINIRGTLTSLTQMKNIFHQALGFPDNTTIKIYNNCGSLNYLGNKKAGKIIDYLYNGATIYLERKYLIAKEYSYHLNYVIRERRKGQHHG